MGKKILVIDDNQFNVQLVQARLEQKQYEVAAAFSGQEGLEKVKSEKPDLILLDVQMPEMNGYTFMMELDKIQESREIPVIVLTAHQEMQPIFQRKGVKGYLIKPLNFDDLNKLIEECLGN